MHLTRTGPVILQVIDGSPPSSVFSFRSSRAGLRGEGYVFRW
jgi:hypothetical protein